MLAEEAEEEAVIAAAFGAKPPGEEKQRFCCGICAEQNGNGTFGVVMVGVMELARSTLRVMRQQDRESYEASEATWSRRYLIFT